MSTNKLHQLLEEAATKEDEKDGDDDKENPSIDRKEVTQEEKKEDPPIDPNKLAQEVKKLLSVEAVQEKNEAGETALHVGLRTKAPPGCIKLMLDVDLSTTKMEDNNKCLPLHVAISNQAEIQVIQAILKAYPEAVEIKDKRERTPLHLVFDKQETVNPKAAFTILEAYPKASELQDKWGRTPLHTAIQFQAPLEVIQKLISEGPESLKKKDVKGRTPLHQAVEKKASTDIVLAVLHAYPKVSSFSCWFFCYDCIEQPLNNAFCILGTNDHQATVEEDNSKRNPLHVAMESKSPLEVVKQIVEKSPKRKGFFDKTKKLLVMKDMYGMPPLSSGLKHQAPIKCVMFVLRACTKMTKVEDNEKRLPLHIAMTHKAPNDPIVKTLVEKYPDATKALDQWLRTPLHSGMEFRAQVNAIKTVLGIYPKATELVDSNKRYPLHLGMRFEAHKEAIELVMNANKSAIECKDAYEHTPLHEALARRAPPNCVKVILDESSQETIKAQDATNSTCLHLGTEKDAKARVIEALLKKCPELGLMEDNDGNTPLHIGMMNKAKLDCIKALLKYQPQATKVKNKEELTPYQVGVSYCALDSCLEEVRKAKVKLII